MTELLFPGQPGCAAAVTGDTSAPRQCLAEPTHTVAHTYRYPRRVTLRLMVCGEHADGDPTARPMDDADRAELDGRRWQWGEALAGRRFERVAHAEES